MNANGPPTLKHLYESILRRYNTEQAIKFKDEKITYAELEEQSAKLGNALIDLGLTEEDKVGILLTNRPEYTVIDIGLARAGLTKVPMNDMLAKEDIKYMLRNSDARAVIIGPDFSDIIQGICPDIETIEWVISTSKMLNEVQSDNFKTEKFETLLESAGTNDPTVSVTQDTLAGIFHTGGTTGDPKGVKHSQKNLSLNALAHALELDIQPQDNLLLMTPLPHSAGLIMAGGLTQGSTHFITQGFDAEQALRLIERHEISWTFMVPTMIYRVLDVLEETSYDVSSLDTLVYGAAPMKPARLREGLEKLGDVFLQLYGQYETPDLITTLSKTAHNPENETRLSSCGTPTTMCEVKVVDENGGEVATGKPGEIIVRSAYSMDGYYKMPEKTSEAMSDGWVYTGDIGKRDEEGYFYIVDRDSDVIVSGGMNVYSVTVEDIIQQNEQVSNVAVIGVPDDDWGEAVKAVVVPEGETIDELELRKFCSDNLADYKVPKSFDVVDELPTTPYGKLDKKKLRRPYWETENREVT